MGGIRVYCFSVNELSKISNLRIRGSLFSSIQDPPPEWSYPVGSLQRDRRGGHSIALPFNRSERVS